MKNKPENVIMTEGDPKKIIFRFAQPLIFANLFQQLYNTMDTIIVGKINGDEALAAVGVSFAVTMVMIAVATGTGIGTIGAYSEILRCREQVKGQDGHFHCADIFTYGRSVDSGSWGGA